MFKLGHIFFGFIFALSVILISQTTTPVYAAEGCSINVSGTTLGTNVDFDNIYATAGDTVTIVMTAAPGDFSSILMEPFLTHISSKHPYVVSYTFTAETTFYIHLDWQFASPQNGYMISCSRNGAGPLAANLLDGRLNDDQQRDVAAPVAVYCADGNIDIYKIDAETGDGTRIISVAQVEGSPESTQLLASAEGVSLYWLDTGEYHINTTNFEGKPYWINWVGCSSDALAHALN